MSDEASAQLSASEVDLAAIAATQRLDRYLLELVSLADAEIGTVVGLVLNGAIVVGRIVSSEAMARAVDKHVLTLLEMSATASDDAASWEVVQTNLSGAHVNVVKKERQARQDMIARHTELYGDERISPTEMPGDLAREVIADSARVSITLADANVFPAGIREPIVAGVMRVDIRQVGGWWIVPTDPKTRSASFTFPGATQSA